MTTKNSIVFYHANCDDGFGSAFAAWIAMGDTAEYIPVAYGDDPFKHKLVDKDIYILDFSFDKETTLAIQAMSARLVILDHHKTAREALESIKSRVDIESVGVVNVDHIEFNMNHSGAWLSWTYFNYHKPTPPLILHIQDNDLWQFGMTNTKPFIRRLRSIPMNFSDWEAISNMDDDEYDQFVNEGRAIQEFFDQQCEMVMRMGKRRIILDGIEGLGCNCTKMFASDIGNIFAKESGTFGLTWMETKDGKVEFSIRSIGEFDVSAIAKKFGGGGHRNAAGFSLSPLGMSELVTLWSTPQSASGDEPADTKQW